MATKAATGGKTTGVKYRYVGYHAATLELEDGTCPQVGPGDYIELSAADYDALGKEFQASLIDASGISAEQEVTAPEQPAQEPQIGDEGAPDTSTS